MSNFDARAILTGLCVRAILHTVAAPALRAAIKTEPSYRNDTIIVPFSQQIKNKYNAKVALYTQLNNSGFNFTKTAYIFFKITHLSSYPTTAIEERVIERVRPIFGDTK